MRPLLITALPLLFLDALIIPAASDSTLLTISCDQPKGIRMEYGVSVGDALAAAANNVPDPKPSFTGPRPDAYVLKPTILINRARTQATIVWSRPPEEEADAKRRLAADLPPLSDPNATEMPVVEFSADQITLAETALFMATTYSFFPKLGVTFFADQRPSLGLRSAIQLAFFAHCEFSWDPLEAKKWR